MKICLLLELNVSYTLRNPVDASKHVFTVGRHAPSRQALMSLLENISQSNSFLSMFVLFNSVECTK